MATVPATGFEQLHQRFVREGVEHQLQAFEITSVMNDDAKLFKRFMDEPDSQRWMTDVVFTLAYEPRAAQC